MLCQIDIQKIVIDMLIESSTIGIQISCDGKVIYVNEILCSMFHYVNPHEVIGINIEKLYSNMHNDNIGSAAACPAVANGTPALSTVIGIRKDGSLFNVLLINSRIKYHEKPSLLTLVIDLSLEQNMSSRLSRLGRDERSVMLIRGIAHEINNIIGIISGSIDLISMSVPQSSPNNVFIEQATAACKRGKELSRQLFRLAPRPTEEPASVSLGSIVNDALQILYPTIPRSIDISWKSEVPPGEDLIRANPLHLLEVLTDLCRNAIDAMQENGGTMEIRVCKVHLDSKCLENMDSCLRPGHYLRLSLKDTGNAMDPSLIAHIFDPFYTTRGSGEGHGLEFAIAQATMRNINGTITVESVPRNGTTFNLFFPQQECHLSAPHVDACQPPTGSCDVLLIQDDLELGDWGVGLLEDLGYAVTRKSSIADAFDLMQDTAAPIDIILVDGNMLQKGTVHSIAGLRALRPFIPIILWSPDPGIESEEGNEVYSLKKPTTGKDLELLIRHVLNVPLCNL